MANLADDADVLIAEHFERSLRAARVPVPAGVAGECDDCGEDSPRLIGGYCAPCRDRQGRRR